MIKIKPLLPVLKEKKRYILFEADSKMSDEDIKADLRGFIGDFGLAKAGLRFIKHKNNKEIIQVNNKSLDEIRAGLALINKTRIRTLKVSGTINKLNKIV